MRAVSACYEAVKPRRARSHLLEPVATSSSSSSSPRRGKPHYGPARSGELPRDDRATHYDPLLRILSSPLRRCLLTNKVLPCDMMVRFELTRPLPSPLSPDLVVTGSSSARAKQQPAQQLLLEPSRILHPRFDPAVAGQGGQTTGKGLWVTCWSEAVEALAKKGSYKRLNPSASMPAPALVSAQVESQLARRVVQEIELLAERIKSWPVASRGGPISSWEDVPVRLVSRDDMHARGLGRLDSGLRVIAALDLASCESSSSPSGPICDFVPSGAPAEVANVQASAIPVYHLSRFFRSALLPPDSLRSFRPRPAAPESQTSETRLLAAAREPIETLLALLARRFRREGDGTAGTIAAGSADAMEGSATTEQGDMILLVAPRDPLTEAEKMRAKVVVPLAVALRRLRLWTGEEWARAE